LWAGQKTKSRRKGDFAGRQKFTLRQDLLYPEKAPLKGRKKEGGGLINKFKKKSQGPGPESHDFVLIGEVPPTSGDERCRTVK